MLIFRGVGVISLKLTAKVAPENQWWVQMIFPKRAKPSKDNLDAEKVPLGRLGKRKMPLEFLGGGNSNILHVHPYLGE